MNSKLESYVGLGNSRVRKSHNLIRRFLQIHSLHLPDIFLLRRDNEVIPELETEVDRLWVVADCRIGRLLLSRAGIVRIGAAVAEKKKSSARRVLNGFSHRRRHARGVISGRNIGRNRADGTEVNLLEIRQTRKGSFRQELDDRFVSLLAGQSQR